MAKPVLRAPSRTTRLVLFCVLLAFVIGGGAALATLRVVRSNADDAWRTIDTPPAFTFPRDHGAHPDTRTEWWYATGEVADDAGARFGFQFTLFRAGFDTSEPAPDASSLRARHVLAAHVTLIDLARSQLRHVERVRRDAAGLAHADRERLHVWLDDQELRVDDDGTLHVTARAAEKHFAFDFVLTPAKPLVLHGHDGLSRKGPGVGNASAYVSWTRLAVAGTLELDGRTRAVDGEAWFDHEWGTSQLGPGVVGWDWFALRLVDGRELMLYRLRTADGGATEHSSGTLVERDGTARTLRADEFELTALEHWTSPRTNARYPARWRVACASAGVEGELRTLVRDCEVDGSASTATIYWEGLVELEGTVAGRGFGELTGYARSMEGRF